MNSFQPFADFSHTILIDGEFQRSAATGSFDVIDPASAEVVGTVADSTDAELDTAIAGALVAQRAWSRLSALDRTDALHRIANSIEENQALLAESLTREMGKPYKEAFDEAYWAILAFRHYAETSRLDNGRIAGPVVGGHQNYVTKHPLGVVGIIMTFNFPFCLFAWEAAAALGAGNAVVLKPSEQTSLSSLLLMRCLLPHLPSGLIACVTGGGRIGGGLVAHRDVHGVAFTGSVTVGKMVASACAETFKKALIETSGNDPFIVMPSADLDVAARAAVFAAFFNAGQVCTSAERFYIHEAIYDDFVSKVIDLAREVRIGNGLDHVDMGPMVSERERTRFEALVNRAIEEGASVAFGGGRPAGLDKGFFVNPVILKDVSPDAEIMNVESFGPVMSICKVADFDEAIVLSNRSEYGLGSTVYTTDLKETARAIEELECGMTWINAPLMDNNAQPFGGRKLSGIGSQLGSEGLDQFRHSKMVMIDPDCTSQDFWWFPYSDKEAFGGDQ
ncbi:aldehyde dehydrogenase [Parahaliea maris]|uniref:Aldehyde dehydrogenase n=1 Tax=Parahaliea maris TaxID=2716870 RepID=A0A5C8ZTM2_9GAMM|nr:aldehyde dehydrogenase family protein [Parahaliea maris]TXS91848.1 aldehyde dehydrogenase [Parahaliea maris]